MNDDELKAVFLSLVNEDDPYKIPKQLDLKNWCNAFLVLFNKNRKERIPFFLEILSEEKCWKNTNTIHHVRLNRIIVARKIVKHKNSRDRINPLNFLERYLVACWCCLEKDIFDLFQEFKQGTRTDDITALKMLEQQLGSSERLAIYWTYIMSGCVSQMNLKEHLYEYGLDEIFLTFRPFVEAVAFFWTKISLTENTFNTQQKSKIILKTTVRAASGFFRNYPEIFEYCITRINPRMYPEVLKRDIAKNHGTNILFILKDTLRLDLIQNFFHSCKPDAVSDRMYHTWLTNLAEIDEYPDYYANAAVNIFMDIWMKEGFDRHRAFVLEEEMSIFGTRGIFLMSFARKNCMEPVLAVLNKASPFQMKLFMKAGAAHYICSVLEKRGDFHLLHKFYSYV